MNGTESQFCPPSQADVLAELRQKVRLLEGFKAPEDGGGVQIGVAEIDEALPCGYLPTGVNHEFLCESREGQAATAGFLSALLPRLPRAPIVWITREQQLYAPGLGCYDLDARQIYVAQVARDQEALWAMEESLRCKGLAAVVAETADADLTATRRLQLAAESSGVTGFLLRHNPRNSFSTACVTRWKITAAPAVDTDLPGNGHPTWHVELCRARGGRPGAWTVEWADGGFRLAQSREESRRNDYSLRPGRVLPLRTPAFAYA